MTNIIPALHPARSPRRTGSSTNLRFAVKVIPKEKLICAIANYGYDWVLKPKQGKLPADAHDSSVSVQEAWLAARDSMRT